MQSRQGIIQGRNAQYSASFIKTLFTTLLIYLILMNVVGYKSVLRNAEREVTSLGTAQKFFAFVATAWVERMTWGRLLYRFRSQMMQ